MYLNLIPFSTTDKVSHRQHTEDLEVLERKLTKRIDDKVFPVIHFKSKLFQGFIMKSETVHFSIAYNVGSRSKTVETSNAMERGSNYF